MTNVVLQFNYVSALTPPYVDECVRSEEVEHVYTPQVRSEVTELSPGEALLSFYDSSIKLIDDAIAETRHRYPALVT